MDSKRIVVEPIPISSTSLKPHIDDPEIARLLPQHGEYPIRSSVIIHGINNAIANGIRRVLLTEMDNMALYINQDSFTTDDPFVMIDMITRRVLLIPLVQSQIQEGMQFALDFTNQSDEPMDVMSINLVSISRAAERGKSKKGGAASATAREGLPFYETINIVTLQPHKKIQFVATVTRGNGQEDAAFATAFTVQSIPLDERPVDIWTEDAGQREPTLPYNDTARYIQSSSASSPSVYQIIFETVGKGKPERILARALSILIARMRAIADAPIIPGQERHASGSSARTTSVGEDISGLYLIKILGETQTVGNLFVRCCYDVFPHINFAAFDLDDLTGELVIRIQTQQEDIETVRKKTIQYTIDCLESIKRFF